MNPHHPTQDILRTPTVAFAIRLQGGIPSTADSLFPFAQVSLLQIALALQERGARVEVVSIRN